MKQYCHPNAKPTHYAHKFSPQRIHGIYEEKRSKLFNFAFFLSKLCAYTRMGTRWTTYKIQLKNYRVRTAHTTSKAKVFTWNEIERQKKNAIFFTEYIINNKNNHTTTVCIRFLTSFMLHCGNCICLACIPFPKKPLALAEYTTNTVPHTHTHYTFRIICVSKSHRLSAYRNTKLKS